MAISITDTWATVDPPFGVELYYSGAWHDVFSDVGQAGLSCSRGRKKPGQHVPASTFGCELANPTGEYSPRNPNSSLYGLIGRNTPVRAWVEAGSTFLDVNATADSGASTPDGAALSVTGDIELQFSGWLPSWRVDTDLVGKWVTSGGQKSYALHLNADGTVHIAWSEDGSSAAVNTSTAAVPIMRGECTVKATLDVSNGGNHVAEFYTSQDSGSTWTQLGDTITNSGTTSIYDGSAGLIVGDMDSGARLQAKVYWAKVLDGIGGSEVANPSFESEDSGTTSFADSAGNTWTVTGDADLWNRHYRYWGEVNSWPQEWGTRGSSTAYSPIAAAGVMQRFDQGEAPLKSTYFRACTSPTAPLADVVAYWPMEVAAGAIEFPSGLPGAAPLRQLGTASTQTDTDSFPCSDALQVAADGWRVSGPVPTYIATGEIQMRVLVKVPDAGVSADTRLFGFDCTGSASSWWLQVGTAGTLWLEARDGGGTVVLSTTPSAFDVNGRALRVEISLTENAGDVDYRFATLELGASTGSYVSGTLSSHDIGRASWAALAQDSGLAGCTVGQATVQSAVTSVWELADQFYAYRAEDAVTRIERLAGEESIGIETLAEGNPVTLGYQGLDTVLGLLREAEDSDLGILYEPRTSSDLAYRAGISLCGQPAALALAYTDNMLDPFKPVDDTREARNKVTVERRDTKAAATEEDSTSSMGTQARPAGIGIYEEKKILSLGHDGQTRGQAAWRVGAGTVDEARWPSIGIDLAHPTFKADAGLTRSVLLLDVGDRITVDDLPDWLPPFTVDQLIQGYEEEITPTHFRIRLACSPYTPNRVLVWDTDRYTADGVELTSDITTSATTIAVTNPAEVEWTHADGDFTVAIDGEEITVGGVSGTGTSQSFTGCTRSVNGVVAAHSAGAAVDLARPHRWGL